LPLLEDLTYKAWTSAKKEQIALQNEHPHDAGYTQYGYEYPATGKKQITLCKPFSNHFLYSLEHRVGQRTDWLLSDPAW
jgi:hypothetical protein